VYNGSYTNILKIPSPYYQEKFKFPKLSELHQWLFGEDFEGAHDALNDVKATSRI
jgi:inhibitor of KinA sporulation pathway (predicted exonuclease)